MFERVVRFGPRKHLVGILTLPDAAEKKTTAVIILNSGAMHRVGACRVSVILARVVAGDGHPVLRFDFSGVGDSAARRDNLELHERSVTEVREAMDFLSAETQCERFVLHGLCSGARDAFETALCDERVIAISQIDSHAYPNLRWYLNYYGPRVLQLSTWKEYFAKIPAKLARLSSAVQPAESDENIVADAWPPLRPRQEIEDGYRQLVDRGVKFYVVFTGSWNFIYNYANQFFDTYAKVDFGDSIDLRYMPEANHILTDPEARFEVIQGCRNLLRSLTQPD